MEFLFGFLSNISRDLVCGAVNQLRYPCCFNNFVKEFEKEKDDLIATRKSVQECVDDGKKQSKKTIEVVHKWLNDADCIEDVNNLLNKAITKKSCCSGFCPNLISRYYFGRKLANKKKELEEFNKKGGEYLNNIAQLQRVATLPSETLNSPSDKYLKFESRESAFKQVMEAVKDGEVNMIGLYGMGGCGKTTLAEEVKKIAEAEHLFDKVLFVTVSSSVEVRGIQERIASLMQYTFPVNEERGRATALCERLTQENKILVILDDVWQKLDFGAIGIPLTEHHKGCKVLITTRSEDVCTLMDCQKKIQLQILTDEEAWTLFQKQAHISEDDPDTLKHLAREISDECKGLPVAIAAVAGSLKGKDEVIWRVALNRLRNSKPMNIEKGLRDPYNCLQLSFDYLDTEEAKSLFLLCSVFPEDYRIPIEDLIKLAIGLGVVGEVRSYDEARSEVIAAKIKLVSSCLLMLDAYSDKNVKMHDLVRDVAHFIAKNKNKVIKCQLENEVILEQSSIRYLWCKEFPNDLDCSNLEFLRISSKLEILDENFERMGKLRVLVLDSAQLKDRPPLSTMPFKTLTNLRCLILRRWELSDISFIRYTKKLQSLSLRNCSIPSFLDLQTDDAVKQLTNLKLLELINCEMERNNYNVIGRIPQLEELCIIDFDNKWNDCNEDTVEFFKTLSVPQGLQSYVIIFGNLFDHDIPREGTLNLPCFNISNEAIMGLAKRAKVLGMGNIEGGAKNIIPDVFQMKEGSMNKLNVLKVCYSKEIECLVDTSNHLSEVGILFSELVKLKIRKMDNLRVLWHGCLPRCGTFQKLETLYLVDCPELVCLFTHSPGLQMENAKSTVFQNLREVRIIRCGKLKYVFSTNTGRGLPQLKYLSIEDCNELEQIIENIIPPAPGCQVENAKSTFFQFQNLQLVLITRCEKLKYVFSANTVRGLPQLQQLHIKDCNELDQIIEDIIPSESGMNNAAVHHHQHEIISENTSIPSASPENHSPGLFTLAGLTIVEINSCPKLSTMFTLSTAKTLTSLKVFIIQDCDGLEQIVTGESAHKNEKEDFDQDLQSVISMFTSLETVSIIRCAKLEVIFPLSCPPELVSLEIRECEELKQIMEQDLEQDKYFSNFLSPQPHFAKLAKLTVEKCPKLKRVFSRAASIDLSNLEILIINKVGELEELIGCEHGKGHKIEKAKVELPKLKLLIFLNLSSLCQGIELMAVKHRFVHNCPKLALTSTTTLREFYKNIPKSDFKNTQFLEWEVRQLVDQINESEDLTNGDPNELPLSQINKKSEKEFIEEVEGSGVQASTTSTNIELIGISSPNPLDISQGETNIELVDQESNSEASLPDKQNIEDIRKENIQEVSVSKGPTNKTLSTGVEGINFGDGGGATHTKFSGQGILAQGSEVVEIDAKLNESNTVTRTRLEAYKHLVDLDETQIALLVEAIAVYPHLWNSCQKFSERFQAWMLKTLADMLLLLRNESADGVTPQREKEFHKLCDEAIKLGFDSSWVDEMRKHVVARDPKLEEDRAQIQINELFKRSTGADIVPDSHVVELGVGRQTIDESTIFNEPSKAT